MCGRGTRRVGKQHSHRRTPRTTVCGCGSYRNMCSAVEKGNEREREREISELNSHCHSNVSGQKQQGARLANLLPVSSYGCSLWQSRTATTFRYSSPPNPPPPPILASHACVLYTRMLFHLRQCFFSELCPDELVRRWIGFAVFQSNALANVEHRLPYPYHPGPSLSYMCAHIFHTLHFHFVSPLLCPSPLIRHALIEHHQRFGYAISEFPFCGFIGFSWRRSNFIWANIAVKAADCILIHLD